MNRSCATCGYTPHPEQRVIGICIPGYHELALIPDRSAPHPEDIHVRRLLAQIEAFAAFDMTVSTEDVLDRYLMAVTS